jgi:hypothetical protein
LIKISPPHLSLSAQWFTTPLWSDLTDFARNPLICG